MTGSGRQSDIMFLARNGAKLLASDGTITNTVTNVETVALNPLGDSDRVTINDLTGTGVSRVNIDLGAARLAGHDIVTLNGPDAASSLSYQIDQKTLVVNGGVPTSGPLPGYTIHVSNTQAGDAVVLNGGAGADNIVVGLVNRSAPLPPEDLLIHPGDGADHVTLAAGSFGVAHPTTIDLAGSTGLADGKADVVTLNANEIRLDLTSAGQQSAEITGFDGFADTPDRKTLLKITHADASDSFVINGTTGEDILSAFDIHATVNGGDGDDFLDGDSGVQLNGGAGDDSLEFNASDLTADTTLNGGAGDDGLGTTASQAHAQLLAIGGDGYDRFDMQFAGPVSMSTAGAQAVVNVDGGGRVVLSGVEALNLFIRGPGPVEIADLSGTSLQKVNLERPGPEDIIFTPLVHLMGNSAGTHIGVSAFAIDFLGEPTSDVIVTGMTAPASPGHDSEILISFLEDDQAVSVSGGAGHDTIDFNSFGYRATLDIDGGTGADTINGVGIGHINVTGGDGNDVINDGDGDVSGGNGNDTLTHSGDGGIVFEFHRGETGADLITGFHSSRAGGFDVIRLNDFADRSFGQALANHHIVQSGADVLVTDGLHTIVTLSHVSLSSLQAADFVFG